MQRLLITTLLWLVLPYWMPAAAPKSAPGGNPRPPSAGVLPPEKPSTLPPAKAPACRSHAAGRSERRAGNPQPSTTKHWSFVPPQRPPVPRVKNAKWVRNAIDAFVLARLEKEKIQPSPEADRVTLLRRLYFDLLGLPPGPEEVNAFVMDKRPDAYVQLVDRLLGSPHFGEQWGRHWLDLARYADSDGYEKDSARPYAWLYRDWVINAINRDLSFDQFTLEQLAGDLLPDATVEQKTATGFHRQTLTNKEGGVDQEEFRCKATVDRASTTGTIWLGLTVGCAECHSHKYDPIAHREFYQFYAFFNNASEKDIPAPRAGELDRYNQEKAPWEAQSARLASALEMHLASDLSAAQTRWEAGAQAAPTDPQVLEPASLVSAEGATLKTEHASTIVKILQTPATQRDDEQKATLAKYYREEIDPGTLKFRKQLAAHARQAPKFPETKAMAFEENDSPRKTHIHVRGDFLRKGDEVQPGVLSVLHPFKPRGEKPDRLDLARWLFDPANPLTSRVTVNHIWKHLVGRGLVATVDDFGARGEKPSHPELLDWLAVTFMTPVNRQLGVAPDGSLTRPAGTLSPSKGEREGVRGPFNGSKREPKFREALNSRPGCGWSRKALIKLIVTSATYRQASRIRPDLIERDPNNLWLARQNRFRLEAENIRDAYLAASGLLAPAIGGPSVRPPLPADIAAIGYANSIKWKESEGADRYRRGLYTFFQRTVPYPMLTTFDAPEANVTCTRRERSNTPLQALTSLNDPVFFECARALGRRIAAESATGAMGKIRKAFQLCLSREPTPEELARLAGLYHDQWRLVQSHPGNAAKIVGDSMADTGDVVEAATLVAVARTLLNLDEFVTRE